MNITCQNLSWDSDFFGFPVGRLCSDDTQAIALESLVSAVQQDARLVYYASKFPLQNLEVTGWQLLLVDRKTTLVKEVNPQGQVADFIRPYDSATMAEDRLMDLAILSGTYSRFNVDPRIGKQNFERMYSLWMQNSLRKQIAFEVLISENEGEVSGFVTLGEKNGRGDIGIIAVDTLFRGRGIGKALMLAAEHAFAGMGYSTAQVVTQGANMPAIKLYESCGYTVDTVEYFYHLWRQ